MRCRLKIGFVRGGRSNNKNSATLCPRLICTGNRTIYETRYNNLYSKCPPPPRKSLVIYYVIHLFIYIIYYTHCICVCRYTVLVHIRFKEWNVYQTNRFICTYICLTRLSRKRRPSDLSARQGRARGLSTGSDMKFTSQKE